MGTYEAEGSWCRWVAGKDVSQNALPYPPLHQDKTIRRKVQSGSDSTAALKVDRLATSSDQEETCLQVKILQNKIL